MPDAARTIPAPPTTDDPRDQAHASLRRGTAFLRAQARHAWLDRPWDERETPLRARVVANWIGELDRLLHVLLDSAALYSGRPATARQRNTANKLAALCTEAAWSAPRLDGLARARATFRYTQGAARRADVRGGSHMTVGWTGPCGALRRFRLGERIEMGSAALIEVCDLYDELAAQVVRAPLAGGKEHGHQGI